MSQRFEVGHNDMLGKIQSANPEGTVWSLEAITNTTFIIGALASSNDTVQVTIQVPHGRQIGSTLDSIHIHYVLQAASGAGEVVKFTAKYVWVQPGDNIPAAASWTAIAGAGLTLTLAAHNAGYYGIHNLDTEISCPAGASEGYGGMLLIEIIRIAAGNTYGGKLGILDVDAHTHFNKLGSVNETSD
jgi:hypothetical protein